MEKRSWVQKAELIKGYVDRIQKSSLIVFMDFTYIDAQTLTEVRQKLKDSGGEMLIGKNTLFYRAFMNTPMADHREVLVGPTALVFAYADPVAVAKIIYDLGKELNKDNPLEKIKGAYMQGRFLRPAEVQALAELPPKEVLISKLMGVIQAPIVNFILALKSAPQKLVLTLKAIEEKKS